MINVLSIAPYRYLPAVTGGQKNIALFYQYLSKHVNLTCASVKNNSVDNAAAYQQISLFSNSALRYINPFYFFSLKRIIKEQNITHVMLEHPYYGWLGYLLKKFVTVKLIIHSHNIEGIRFKSLGKWWWRLLWSYEKLIHRCADLSFFITEEDHQYALANFKLPEEKCAVITYGTEHAKTYTFEEKQKAKLLICQTHRINPSTPLLLYSAALGYGPNLNGLDFILEKVTPSLLEHKFDFNIIICGGGLPEKYNNLSSYHSSHITYAGFVEDISIYFKAADIFLNPISEGGGIKTKLVEALAASDTAISFQTGAIGIPQNVAGSKLLVSPDKDIHSFFKNLETALTDTPNTIPSSFFNYFYWGKIAEKAAGKMA
ncbi:MAG: glycosyltransferase [Agriterribacter sp.]